MHYTVVCFENYYKMRSLPRCGFRTQFVERSNYKSESTFDLHDDWIGLKARITIRQCFMLIFKSARLLIGGNYKCLYHTVML